MSPDELRASLSLAAVFALRLFGMFIILPVFALYAETLPGGSSPTMGSSTSTALGRCRNAALMTSRCFMPCEKLSISSCSQRRSSNRSRADGSNGCASTPLERSA